MKQIKILTRMKWADSFFIPRRFFGLDLSEKFPSKLDDLIPPKLECDKRTYTRHWVECPQPIIVKQTSKGEAIPFNRRQVKPRTASDCAAMRKCDGSVKHKNCLYGPTTISERIYPPCPSFSETLKYISIADVGECNCLEERLPLRFGYQRPCNDSHGTTMKSVSSGDAVNY